MKSLFFLFIAFNVFNLSATIINVPADQSTIGAGISVSVDGDTVLVQPGTYGENISFNGKLITVGSLFIITQDTTYISSTIIDGEDSGTVVYFVHDEDSTAVLCGFTIMNGSAYEYGGGIKCSESSPSLENVTIISNTAPAGGGGIYCFESNPNLINVRITGNSSHIGGGIHCFESNPNLLNVKIDNNTTIAYGGGILCSYNSSPNLRNVTIANNSNESYGAGMMCSYDSSPSLKNVTIDNNSAWYRGGGIYCIDNSSPSLENVTITNNSAASGGGIYCWQDSNPSLVNVMIVNNSATNMDGSGGGIYCRENSAPSLENVTIANNSANYAGGGICCWKNSSPNLINCIMWNNIPQEIYFSEYLSPNIITISYSDILGGEAGIVTNNNGTVYWLEGNIDEEPLFVGTGDHPFMLQDISTCVNAGIPDTTGLNLPEFDLAGNPRVYGGRIDMGAYENQNVIVDTDFNTIQFLGNNLINHPNPFNPSTTIEFSIQNNSEIELSIYNIKGQKIKILANNIFSKGSHSIIWNGDDENNEPVSSGIYFYKLNVNGKTEAVKKCLLLK